MHHYSSAAGPGADAVAFDETGWYDLLASANRMEDIVTSIWATMRESDRRHHVRLVVDEWGAWHDSAPIVDPSHLFESQSTMRDAVVTGLTLDIFHRHAEKVGMANVAQLINCIHSLFFAHQDRFVVTPSYHVFAMYAAHQGAQSVRTEFAAPMLRWTAHDGTASSLRGLSGSASRQGDQLVLTVTNASMRDACSADVVVRGATIRAATATTLAAATVHDVNSFDRPDAVRPSSRDVAVASLAGGYPFPAASVTRLALTLA